MLAIGSNLREARGRRGLSLAQIDAATHIRRRYLKALENERFDLLPGTAYARGFLRTYAEYLGLDADAFVEEYNARFAPPDEAPDLASLRPLGRRRLRLPRTTGVFLLIVSVAVVAWRLEAGGTPTTPISAGGGLTTRTHETSTSPPATASSPAVRHPRRVTLALTASRGPCWLLVRMGSRDGRHLYEGMLAEGESARFSGRRLWIRLGAPQALDAKVNGKRAGLPDDTANVVVTSSGIRTVKRG